MCKTFKFISGKWKVWCKIKGGAALILNSHYQKQIEDNEQKWHESNSQAVCATHIHCYQKGCWKHTCSILTLQAHSVTDHPHLFPGGTETLSTHCVLMNSSDPSIPPFPAPHFHLFPISFITTLLLWCPQPHLFFSLSDFILGAKKYYMSKRLSLHSLHLTSVNKYCPAVPLPSFMSDLL